MSEPKVLIVDDEEPIRRLLTRWLAMWNYPAKSVGSAAEAIATMKTDPADILICDISMPDQDGLSLVEQVRATWPDVTIIMATGYTQPEVILESRKLGAVAYVTKPFDPYVLRQAVDHAAGRLQFRT